MCSVSGNCFLLLTSHFHTQCFKNGYCKTRWRLSYDGAISVSATSWYSVIIHVNCPRIMIWVNCLFSTLLLIGKSSRLLLIFEVHLIRYVSYPVHIINNNDKTSQTVKPQAPRVCNLCMSIGFTSRNCR